MPIPSNRRGPLTIRRFQGEHAQDAAQKWQTYPSLPGRTFYCAPTGNDSTGDGSFGNPWLSPESFRLIGPRPGDTLYLRGGVYTGLLAPNPWDCEGTQFAQIAIAAYPGESPVLDGTSLGTYAEPFWMRGAKWTVVDGIGFKNFNPTQGAVIVHGAGLGYYAQNNTVRNCTIWALAGLTINEHGIYLSGNATSSLIEYNWFYGTWNGVTPDGGAAVEVYHGPADGYPFGATGFVIRRNLVAHWAYGLQVWESTSTGTISHNTLIDCLNAVDSRFHSWLVIEDNAMDAVQNVGIADVPALDNAGDPTFTLKRNNYAGQTFGPGEVYDLASGSAVGGARDGTDAGRGPSARLASTVAGLATTTADLTAGGGAAALAATVSGTSTTAGQLTTSIALAATLAAGAGTSAQLTTSIPLAGSAPGVATTQGALTTSIRMAGSAAGVATPTAALTTSIPLVGSAAGAAATSPAALTTSIRLAAAVAGQATTTGALTTSIPLVGSAAGVATTAAGLTTSIALQGAAAGQATIVAAYLTGPELGTGTAAGAATTAGALTTQIRMAAAIAGQAATTGALTTGIALQGAVAGQATTAAGLTTSIRMAGAAAGAASPTAQLTTAIPLAGAAAGAAGTAAQLTTQIRLAGSAAGLATAQGSTLSSPQSLLTGSSAGSSATQGSLTTAIALAGQAAGHAAATASALTKILSPLAQAALDAEHGDWEAAHHYLANRATSMLMPGWSQVNVRYLNQFARRASAESLARGMNELNWTCTHDVCNDLRERFFRYRNA